MGFPRVNGDKVMTSQGVYTTGHQVQMVRVNTHAVATKVVALEFIRDWPN